MSQVGDAFKSTSPGTNRSIRLEYQKQRRQQRSMGRHQCLYGTVVVLLLRPLRMCLSL